ncbi:hypothetical protein [Roseibium polysiphoniae]|uniref:Uncharacterized protein n=1 Tax=Roseibium polysiphoniae TaxID=2571221 RepID=A0ABR9CCJ2_9HYPH|nr:hypothetical protein [Roseibium polysiphoniae]MBD8877619.1 hypothetical protein [Roseibium polysiphoniae]
MKRAKSALASALFAGLAFAALPVPLSVAFTDTYETAPEQDPAVVLDGREVGPGYLVLSPVRGDGYLRLYEVETDLGIERLSGDGLLELRLHELKVLSAMEKLESDASFLDGLKKAAMRPAEFVESTVSDPVGTAKNTISGVGKMFGRLSRGVEQAVSGEAGSPAELAKSIAGQARARRELAVKLGVDPYTNYKPLSDKLDQAASVSTAGSLTVNALLALVPGGMISQVAGRAESFRTSLVDSTRAELEQRTADTLREVGVSDNVIDQLLKNPFYTPAERAVIAYHLRQFSMVDGLDILAVKAAAAQGRDEAYFQLRKVVLTLHYHETIAGLASIRQVAGYPIAIRRDGAAALIMPLDMVAWTEATASAFATMNEGLSDLPFPPTAVDFLMTGDITDLAAERIASFGWQITANMPMPDGPIH